MSTMTQERSQAVTTPSTGVAAPRPKVEGAPGLRTWRRRWWRLVDPARQARGSAVLIAIVGAMLGVLNGLLYLRRLSLQLAFADASQEVQTTVADAHTADALLILLSSIAFFAVFGLVTLIDSNRHEGPAYRLVSKMQDVERGNFRAVIKLRGGDRLGELAESFNAMTLALRDRAREEAKELGELAVRARRVDSKYSARDLAADLQRLEEKKKEQYT